VSEHIVNVASVEHLSPFRYPGGKTWLVPYVMRWLAGLEMPGATLVEPFAGGGIVALSAVQQSHVANALLVELDTAVAAVWRTMLSRDNGWLCRSLIDYELTRENVVDSLAKVCRSRRELAFQTILRNRVQRGGILAPGASLMLSGENGRGIASRWYPKTLAARIAAIGKMRDRLKFVEGDGLEAIRGRLGDSNTIWFVDPPYTAGGKRAGSRLYAHSRVDHELLFALIASASGPAMLTYDDTPEVRALSERYGFQVTGVPMKNTHHNVVHELVITKPALKTVEEKRDAVARVFKPRKAGRSAPSQPVLFS
jgi:DNA adenine methylase